VTIPNKVDPLTAKRIIEEFAVRHGDLASAIQAQQGQIDFTANLFDRQLDFIGDTSKRKAILAGRRSGKSHTIAYYLVKTCYEQAKAITAFIGLTATSAKEIIWDYLAEINLKYKLGAKPNLTNHTWSFPNGSMIYITGADSERETRKHLGKHYDLAIIDECGEFGPHLEMLVRKILTPTMLDRDGTICMIGTPGDICGGFWYEITNNLYTNWSVHKDWDITANYMLPVLRGHKDWKQRAVRLLERIKKEEGYDNESPQYIRQYLGKWVEGSNSLVYSNFSYNKCTFTVLPDTTEAWDYLLGVDFGVTDSSAIIVGAYNKLLKTLYIVESYKQPGLSPENMAHKINQYYQKYNPVAVVADGNGIGAAFLKQLESMYRIPIKLAGKKDKSAFMELLNDDFRQSKVKIQIDLIDLLKEINKLQYRDTKLKLLPEKAEDHCLDALLYLWRYSLHYIGRAPAKVLTVEDAGYDKMLFERELADIKEQTNWWEF
jgi:hypothetical protein